jgi:hypothetical protein
MGRAFNPELQFHLLVAFPLAHYRAWQPSAMDFHSERRQRPPSCSPRSIAFFAVSQTPL